MKNTHENLDAALKSFSKNRDRVKLLSESLFKNKSFN